MTTVEPTRSSVTGGALADAAAEVASALRDPAVVMDPATVGAARPFRHSFSRSLIRRAASAEWRLVDRHVALDDEGQGEVRYVIEAEGHTLSFVGFTIVTEEGGHTDRVIGTDWEITAALVDGPLDDELLATLRSEVPKQERGRLDPRVLTLTRGNRSVRFFDAVADRLAAGRQPDPELVADTRYLMRSTAFYGNGKYGMRSFDGLDAEHPVGAPYRAQMLCGWCYRELSFDVVEHVARVRGGDAAARLDDGWDRFFGLGNATGMGLVPFAFKHPAIVDAWASVREVGLARVRARRPDPDEVAVVRAWLLRACEHFATGTDRDCAPFHSPAQLVGITDTLLRFVDDEFADGITDGCWDRLLAMADSIDVEMRELLVAALGEIDRTTDAEVDEWLRVDESSVATPETVAELRARIAERFGWLDGVALDDTYWWLLTDNNEEPRRAPHDRLDADNRELVIDVALRVRRLRDTLESWDAAAAVAEVLVAHPEHRLAVDRLAGPAHRYGEPRDNACSADYLPLQLQRFQLAMYGMDDYRPKSTDWLRVALFQGAPRLADLGTPDRLTDDWMLPARPGTGPTEGNPL